MKPPAERPPNPVSETYVPPMGTPHRVQTGESWVSLAKGVGIDAWDLIDFNFPATKRVKASNHQLATRYVNWYLREYVGCESSDDGGNNYAFTSPLTGGKGSWKGGTVYLPVAILNMEEEIVTVGPPAQSLGMRRKLYIYDASSRIDRVQAAGRFAGEKDVLSIGIRSGIDNLKRVLDQLVGNHQMFNRVLFQTHGSPGGIWFGNDKVTANTWKTTLRTYASLFPGFTRVYFDGCNVAEGGEGTDFLFAAGNVLLVGGGGDVLGWKNLGFGMPGVFSSIGGHTLHLGGSKNLKRIRFFPRGEPNWPDSWVS
jgi:hypothetical protein